jgi:hypothetical protein
MQGLVLTSVDNLTNLLGSMRANGIPLLKVVTGWGTNWNDEAIGQVCAMPSVLVRTVSGDGARLDPDTVLNEIAPWCAARPQIQIELGNEPNSQDASDDAAWEFRWWFIETLKAVRERYPQARIVSPGLMGKRQETWWRINQDAFSMANSIGFHAYAFFDFTSGDTGDLQRALQQLGDIFPHKPWLGTELGINDTATPPGVKATRYGALHRKLPSQVAGAIWYHYCDQPINADQRAYQLPTSAFPRLRAAGSGSMASRSPASTVLEFVVIDFANVRQAPSPTAPIAGRLEPGTPVLIDSVTNGWAHLAVDNPFRDLGFVAMSLLRKAA